MNRIQVPVTVIDLRGDGYHIKIQVEINRVPAELILDTGASTTVFDYESLLRVHPDLKVRDSDQLTTGLGTSSMLSHKTVIPLLSIGSIEIRDLETALLDLSHINAAYSKISKDPVIGVLGNDILVNYGAVIDYPRRLLSLEKPPPKPTLFKKLLKLIFGS